MSARPAWWQSTIVPGHAPWRSASVTPEAFLFDRNGKLVYHGAIDDNHRDPGKVQKRYLKDALDAVAAGKTPAVQESKSMGCGIKFRGA